jgi:hypothetical protein
MCRRPVQPWDEARALRACVGGRLRFRARTRLCPDVCLALDDRRLLMTKKLNRVLETAPITLLSAITPATALLGAARAQPTKQPRARVGTSLSLRGRAQPPRVQSFASRRRGK